MNRLTSALRYERMSRRTLRLRERPLAAAKPDTAGAATLRVRRGRNEGGKELGYGG